MYSKINFDDGFLYMTEMAYMSMGKSGRIYMSFIGDTKIVKKIISQAKNKNNPVDVAGYVNGHTTIKLDECNIKTYSDGDITHFTVFKKKNDKYMYLYLDHDYSDIFTAVGGNSSLSVGRRIIDYDTRIDGWSTGKKEGLYGSIFQKIKETINFPMLNEWKEYIVNQMLNDALISAAIFSKCNTNNNDTVKSIVSDHDDYKMILEIPKDKKTYKDIIIKGLRSGDICISDSAEESSELKEINTIDQYIDKYGQILCDKVTNNFQPLFDPTNEELSKEVKDRTAIAAAHSKIFSYTAQENAEEAITRSMEVNKHTILSGACGSGKSGIATLSVDAHARKRNHKNYAALVMCPGTMPKEWHDTISSTLPFSDCVMINNLSDIIGLKEKINDKKRKRPIFGIITYSTAKNGYDERPSCVYSKTNRAFICPDCGGKITFEKKIIPSLTSEKTDVVSMNAYDTDFFEKNDQNSMCPYCGASFWEPATKNNINNWIKITKVGWIQKNRISRVIKTLENIDDVNITFQGEYIRQIDRKKLRTKYNYLCEYQFASKKNVMKLVSSFPIARFIRQHMRKDFDYVICDEAHTVEGDSMQHQAFSDVIQSCWRSLSLTGTLSNGYASGLFNILFKTQTAKMIKDGFGYEDCSKFVDKYGVTETTKESIVDPESYGYNNEGELVPVRYHEVKNIVLKKKQVAGVSPMVFANYLMNNTVFLKQEDITSELVPYNEIPVGIEMDDELKDRYNEIINTIRTLAINGETSGGVGAARSNRASAIKGMITYLDMMLDQPFGLDDIVNMNNEVVIESKELDDKKIRNKEQYLIDLCKRKKDVGEKILIYVHWTGKTCIQERLQTILGENGIQAEIMDGKIKMADRQTWVNNKSNEIDAIIVNPRLVDVGLNLLPYTTIVFYEIGNQLSVIRQSSKRSWRINQTHPVEVYFMYYKDTVQEQLLGAISQKLKAATAIEGNFSAEGLSSISSDTDLMNMVASSIVNNENIEIENDGFESIGSIDAGEARKLRAESCIKLGLRKDFEYGNINMLYGAKQDIDTKKKGKKKLDKINTIIDVYDTFSAVI